jgi:hypothetical protein
MAVESETVTLARRFCGPPDSANGGYSAGTLARFVDGVAEVTLRRAPPLDRPLEVRHEAERVVMLDGDELIAEAVATTVDLEAPPPVDLETARDASAQSPFRDLARHPFPTCFACGPKRDEGDGLRLFAGRIPGTESFATVWTPTEAGDEIIWAALDCPSSAVIYLDTDTPPPHVLGRIAARIDERPRVGDPHVIMSWSRGRDGRKAFSASAIYDPQGRLCAIARATWIQLNPE